MASERFGRQGNAASGRVLTLEDVSHGDWTLVSSKEVDECALVGDDEDEAKVRDVVDLSEAGHAQSSGSTLGAGGLRSPPSPTSDHRKIPPQHDKDVLAAIDGCVETLQTLRDEKERYRASLDNIAQSIADQAAASRRTMNRLLDLRLHAEPKLQTIEEQIMKDLGCQLDIDQQSLAEKTSSLRGFSDAVRSLEADISAEEARLVMLLSMSSLCT